MPSRLEPFFNNGIYHVFNKTIDQRIIFDKEAYGFQLVNILQYYRSDETKFGYSQLNKLDPSIAKTYLKKINKKESFRIELLAFCLMPTHFHFLIKQKKDKGITYFMSDLINSFTRYFNIKAERKGPVFLSDFKSVRINNDAQLMHVSRYIHLNPYSSGLVTNYSDLEKYSWSSYKDYIYETSNKLISQKDILSLFRYERKRYKQFVLSNAEHQKTLETIKYSRNW